MDLSLLIGGILTGIVGIIGAIAAVIRAYRPMGRAGQVSRELYTWLESHSIADLIPRDLITPDMTPDELRDAYKQLEATHVIDRIPRSLRRRLEQVIDLDDDPEDEGVAV